MDILALITPQFLVILFAILAVLSLVAAFYGLEYDRRYKKLKDKLKQAQDLNCQLHEKVGQLEAKEGSLREELAVKSQMYEGLKDQYDDLEKDFDKMNNRPS